LLEAQERQILPETRWPGYGEDTLTTVARLHDRNVVWRLSSRRIPLAAARPERPEFIPTLAQAIPRYRERLNVRPGVTGLAQVQLPPDTDLNSVRRKLVYDLHYAQHLGLWLDLRLLLATAG